MTVTSTLRASGGEPATTPPRRLGSVRRTTTHDSTRPAGLLGPVATVARGRDLLTTTDGDAVVLATARLDVTVTYHDGRIAEIGAEPADPRLGELVGASAFSRFRAAIDAAMPGETASHSLRHELIDGLSGALFVSGRAIRAAGVPITMKRKTMAPPIDICAGWASGGTAITGMTEMGPPLHRGPLAPRMERDDDPLAWHDLAPLPPHATRRRRRLDVWDDDDIARVDCFFRDSHFDGDGLEEVVHEYTVRAQVDLATLEFISCQAEMGPLPYSECPAAAASASRLEGTAVDGLRRRIPKTFVGPTTCTHLSDTLRTLEDVGALLAALRDSSRQPLS